MIRAKKSLGQHFLTSRSALSQIITGAKIENGEKVLEIGPGKGILTEKLILAGAKVVAVEKDTALIKFLKEKFSTEIKTKQLKLISGDILELRLKKHGFGSFNYKLIANIPYYITGEILRKFIGGEIKPSLAVLLVQKEVASRIVGQSGKESVLSISVKVYGKPKILKKVPAGAFNPPPKVDSAILLVANMENQFKNPIEEKRFFEILKAGFAHKRKFLAKNLEEFADKEKIAGILANCGIPEKSRAEDLILRDWICLSGKF